MTEWSWIENTCRVCMAEGGDFQPIFTSVLLTKEGFSMHSAKEGSSMHLSEMIAAFSNVQITLGDGLPEQICNTCAEDTINFYLFKIKCEENDKFLRKKLVGKIVDCKEEDLDLDLDADKNVPSALLSNFPDICDTIDDDDSSNYSVPSPQELPESIQTTPEKTKEFICSVCDKRFSRENLLMRHKIAHAQKLPIFPDFSDNLEDDSSSYSVPSPPEPKKTKEFICSICDAQFDKEDLFNKHKITHEDKFDLEYNSHYNPGNEDYNLEGSNIIPDSNYIFLKSEQIEVTEEYEKLYPCDQCNLIYISHEELAEHLTHHHQSSEPEIIPQKPPEITSPDCKENTTKNDEISCEVCNKKFKKELHLKRHMRAHKVLKNFICDKCGKSYMRKEHLLNHIKSHEGVRPHVCQICLKGFNQISNLKDHMRTHNGEKPFLCSTCGKGFNQLGNLRQHTVRHSGVKAHTCTTCGHGFASKGELGAHVRKHTGVRPFVCDVCNTGFTTSSSLVKHKRIHSGEKPYSCDVCHMKFSRSGILSRHKRTHTGEKPYICSFCQKAFTQSNDLNSHLRIHTGEKPFICDECGQAFRQNSALRAHKKTHKSQDRRAARAAREVNEKSTKIKTGKKYEIKCDVIKLNSGNDFGECTVVRQGVFVEPVP